MKNEFTPHIKLCTECNDWDFGNSNQMCDKCTHRKPMTAYLADKYKAVEDNLDNINTMLSNLKSMQDEVRTLIETLNGLAQDLIENTIQVPQA
jgi:hypothetical protein